MQNRDAAMLVRLPTDLKKSLEELAKSHRRSCNMEAITAIEAYVGKPKVEVR